MTSGGSADVELGFRSPAVQRIRRLLADPASRRRERIFVVEGASSISAAVESGWEIEGEFCAPGIEPISPAPAYRLSVGVLERVSDLTTPPGNLALVARRPPVDSLADWPCVLVAHAVRDPGNLGTMFRSAEAAGFDAVVVVAESTDPYGPKVVRSSAGSVFRIPVVEAELSVVTGTDRRVLASSSHRGISHRSADYGGRIAIVVGNESAGLDESEFDVLSSGRIEWVRIEHRGGAESLNVAMAATLLCFEATAFRSVS